MHDVTKYQLGYAYEFTAVFSPLKSVFLDIAKKYVVSENR